MTLLQHIEAKIAEKVEGTQLSIAHNVIINEIENIFDQFEAGFRALANRISMLEDHAVAISVPIEPIAPSAGSVPAGDSLPLSADPVEGAPVEGAPVVDPAAHVDSGVAVAGDAGADPLMGMAANTESTQATS